MSRPRGKSKAPEADTASPHWLLTYSDMVTLLLCFFVMLYSFSSIDIERFQRILQSIQISFLGHSGILEGSINPESGPEQTLEPPLDLHKMVEEERRRLAEQIYAATQAFLAEAGLEEGVSLSLEQRGVVMELPNHLFFEKSQADLLPAARQILSRLADLFRLLPYRVIVEGHTCNLPISTAQFPSNWELSVARAVRVTRYLVEVEGLQADRFIATGYGEYQPVASNDTAEGRAANRRVTIVITLDEHKE